MAVGKSCQCLIKLVGVIFMVLIMVVPRVTFLTRLSCKLSTFYIFNRAISFPLIFTLFLDLEYSSKIPPYQYKALSVEPNKAVTEKCGIEGFPPDSINYVWCNPKGEVIESSRDLNQKLSQFGNYTCNATNGKLTSPPWKYVLEVKEDTGENHRLHCLHCTKSVTCHCTKSDTLHKKCSIMDLFSKCD